jgi:subtilase family serine protease
MSRRHVSIALTLGLTLAGLVAGTSSSSAAPGGRAEHSNRRVCSEARAGQAACDAHVLTDASGLHPYATTTFTQGLTPAQLTSVYGPFGANAPLVAIVDAYAHPSAAADLAVYRQQFGLGTANLRQVNQTGGAITTVKSDVGWGEEEMLDLEMVSAVCPQCSILYVGAKSASIADLGAAVTEAVKLGAKVVSNSYGGGESFLSGFYSQWNVKGVAVTVSSGDGGYGVQFPASSRYAIAVGGTSLTLDANGNRATETAWAGAGSGCSGYIAKPTWQKDTGCTKRTVADVSAVADPYTGVAVYDSFGATNGQAWYVFGGTSVAAPLVGAIFARAGFTTTGYPVQSLYANSSGLFDVTSGSNGSCAAAKQYLCTGTTGYDGPTGNGSPNGSVSPF